MKYIKIFILTVALAFIVLSALAFSEVSNWGVLAHNHSSSVISSVESIEGTLCLFLSDELDVDISDHVVSDVVHHDHFLQLAELGQFHKHFLIEVLKVVHCLNQCFLWHIQPICKCHCSRRILIEMGKGNSLGEGWFVMNTGASVTMPAGTNLKIEWTVNSITNR